MINIGQMKLSMLLSEKTRDTYLIKQWETRQLTMILTKGTAKSVREKACGAKKESAEILLNKFKLHHLLVLKLLDGDLLLIISWNRVKALTELAFVGELSMIKDICEVTDKIEWGTILICKFYNSNIQFDQEI